MSREQCPGSTQPITPRSDVYSLGATLYALLTGRTRFHGCTRQQAYDRICHGDFPPPREAKPIRHAVDVPARGLAAGEIPRALDVTAHFAGSGLERRRLNLEHRATTG